MNKVWRRNFADLILLYHLIFFCLPFSQFVFHSHQAPGEMHQPSEHLGTVSGFVAKLGNESNWHMHPAKELFFILQFSLALSVLARALSWRKLSRPNFCFSFCSHSQSGRSPPFWVG